MKVVAYTRISTDAQDLDKQKHLLLAYAQQQKLMIDEFIEVTISSRESPRERKIDVLLEKLHAVRSWWQNSAAWAATCSRRWVSSTRSRSKASRSLRELLGRKRLRFTDEQPSRWASKPRKIRSGQQGIIHG